MSPYKVLNSKKALVLVAFGLLALVLAGFVLPVEPPSIQDMQQWVRSGGKLGFVIYTMIFVIAAVLMLPVSLFVVLAGLSFGSLLGAVVAWLASTLSACVAFLLARYVARNAIMTRFGHHPLFQRIDAGVRQNGASFLFLTRLVPLIPYGVQNYAYGLTAMRFSTFAAVSLVTMAPPAFLFAFMAGEVVRYGGLPPSLIFQLVLAGLALFGLSFLPRLIARRRGIKL